MWLRWPDGNVTRPDARFSNGRTVRLHVRTRAACHMLMWHRTFGRVMSLPDGDPTGFKNPSRRIFQLPHSISLLLLVFSAWFLEIFALSCPILSSCAYISSLQVYFLPFIFLLVFCYLLEYFIFGEFFFLRL
jgi:hypothetical protein